MCLLLRLDSAYGGCQCPKKHPTTAGLQGLNVRPRMMEATDPPTSPVLRPLSARRPLPPPIVLHPPLVILHPPLVDCDLLRL